MDGLLHKFHALTKFDCPESTQLHDEAMALLARDRISGLEVAWRLISTDTPELKEIGMTLIEKWRQGDTEYGQLVSHEFVRAYHEICVIWLGRDEMERAQLFLDKACQLYKHDALDLDNELEFDLRCTQCHITPTIEALRKVDELAGTNSARMSRVLPLAYLVCRKSVSVEEGIVALKVSERSQCKAIRMSLVLKHLEASQVQEALQEVESLVNELQPGDAIFSRVAKLHVQVLLRVPTVEPEVIQSALHRFIALPDAASADCLELIRPFGRISDQHRAYAVECLRRLCYRLPYDDKIFAYKLELFFLSQDHHCEKAALSACTQIFSLLDQTESTSWPHHFQDYVAHTLWFFASLFINKWLAQRDHIIALLKRRLQLSARNLSGASDRKVCRFLCLFLMETDVVEAKKYALLGLSKPDEPDQLEVLDLVLDLQMSCNIDCCWEKIENLDEPGLRILIAKSVRFPYAKKRLLDRLWEKGDHSLECIRMLLALDQHAEEKVLNFLDAACVAAPHAVDSSLILGTHQDHIRWVANFAWNKGMECMHLDSTRSVAHTFLEKCLCLIQFLAPSDEILTDKRTLVCSIQSSLMTHRREEDYQKAFTWGSEATAIRDACEEKGLRGNEASYVVEFEIRLKIQDANILQFIRKAASSPSVDMAVLLHMARLAVSVGQREVAMELINVYILNCNARGGDKASYAALAPAYRTLVTLQAPADSFAHVSYMKNLIGDDTPEMEVSWLVATAWNIGSQYYKRGEKVDARKWMRLAIDLAPQCGLREKLGPMTMTLQKCVHV